MMSHSIKLMLDSGAFSVWNRGETLDVNEYGRFLKANKKWIHTAVNLDVIPSRPGVKPTHDDVEKAAEESLHNLEVLEGDWGIKAMPVFHQGEDFKWLEAMIKAGFDYVGISPANDVARASRREWLDKVFSYLCGDHPFPRVRTHAFGLTSVGLLLRYPFHTVDSISWRLAGSYGGVIVPPFDGDKIDYTRAPKVVTISDRRSECLTQGLESATLDHVNRYVQFMDMDLDEIVMNHRARTRLNLRYFKQLSDTLTPPRFKANSLTRPAGRDGLCGVDRATFEYDIVFSMNGVWLYDSMATEEDIDTRLLSYALPIVKAKSLKTYVSTGTFTQRTQRERLNEEPGLTPTQRPRRKRGTQQASLRTGRARSDDA